MARFGQPCNSDQTPCQVKIAHNDEGQILVVVAHMYPDRASGKCLQAIGAQDVGVYSQNGQFVERDMSL
jgi:hypothetical protein